MQKAVSFQVLRNLKQDYVSHGKVGFVPTKKTQKNRRVFFESLLSYLQGEAFTLDSAEGYVLSRQAAGVKLLTTRTNTKHVTALANWLHQRGLLDMEGFSTRLKQPRVPKKYRQFYSTAEYEAIILAGTEVGELDHRLHREQKRIARYALLFILTTGCRLSEALSLTSEDIKVTGKRVEVVFHRKTQDKDIQPVADKRLLEFLTAAKGKVFPCTEELLRRVLKRGEKSLGLSGGEITPHSLRHGFATDLLRNGCTIPLVSRALGHSNTRITYETYAHLDSSDVEHAVRTHSSVIVKNANREEVKENFFDMLKRGGFTANANVLIQTLPDGRLMVQIQ